MMKNVLVLVCAVVIIAACGESVPLPVSARQSGQRILIHNETGASIGDCVLELNDGYKTRVDSLSNKSVHRIDIGDFVDGNGKRFSLATHKIQSITISCNEHPKDTGGHASFKPLLTCAAAIIAACRENVPLPVSIKQSGQRILVHNETGASIRNCELEINDGYKTRVDSLSGRSIHRINISDFVDSDGKRFNLATHKIRKILILCKEHPKDIGGRKVYKP